MRKQELIHLHGLAVETRTYLEETHDVPADAFEAYDAYEVAPAAIHRRKHVHVKALKRALDGVVTAIESRSSRKAARDAPRTPPRDRSE